MQDEPQTYFCKWQTKADLKQALSISAPLVFIYNMDAILQDLLNKTFA